MKNKNPIPQPRSPSKSSTTFKNIVSEKEHGFTLIELIVVIIIVGILAAVGISQYSKTVEKSRGAEARQILGQIRKLAYEYYLQNGTVTGITDADLNIGTAANQIPGSPAYYCGSTHYFSYGISSYTSNPTFVGYARRCPSGGKPPQKVYEDSTSVVYLSSNFSTGVDYWSGYPLGNPPPY